MTTATTACILLAGGESTRFGGDVPKQYLHCIATHAPLPRPHLMTPIETTIAAAREARLAPIILVIRSAHIPHLRWAISPRALSGVKVVINDAPDRMESIKEGLVVARVAGCNRAIIHDVARAFVTAREFSQMTAKVGRGVVYAQYYTRIVDGLVHIGNGNCPQFCNPAEYWEVATPLMISVDVARDIVAHCATTHTPLYEFYPFLSDEQKRTQCQWFEGSRARLRKITYADDVCNGPQRPAVKKYEK